MVRKFNTRDEGKRVVGADGEEIGTVDRVSANTAHLRPASGLSDRLRDRLGWEATGENTYELAHDQVERIESDEIRLKATG